MSHWSQEEIRQWVESQSWYQRIPITDDIETPGRFNSQLRFELIDFGELQGKTVLDVGCNSGMYCFEAKKRGASKVVGIDVNEERLTQARTLAEILDLEVEFLEMSLHEAKRLGQFDVVLCFAVLTEMPDLVTALQALASLTGQVLILELALFGTGRSDIRFPFRLLGSRALRMVFPQPMARLRHTKKGLAIAPDLPFMEAVLGDSFQITDLGASVRYRLLRLERK